MKINSIVVVVIVYVCQAGAVASAQSEDRQVRDFAKQWTEAWVENDAATMTDFYNDSENTVMVMSSGRQTNGIAGIRQVYKESFQEVEIKTANFDDLTINATDSSAFVVGTFVADTKPVKGEGSFRISCRTSLTLAKFDDSWKIIGEHSSILPDVDRVQRLDR